MSRTNNTRGQYTRPVAGSTKEGVLNKWDDVGDRKFAKRRVAKDRRLYAKKQIKKELDDDK